MCAVCAICGVPYETGEFGSPGAMKLVCGLPVSLAAEQRAMVGELLWMSVLLVKVVQCFQAYLLDIASVKKKFLITLASGLPSGLAPLF